MSSTKPIVFYLHGFRSSPLSGKAQLLRQATRNIVSGFWAPQLPCNCIQAVEMIEKELSLFPKSAPIVLIGSSLGGFLATVVLERNLTYSKTRAILLNPAIHPARDLARYIGPQTFWHRQEETFEFTRQDHNDLIKLERDLTTITSERYGLVACTGDEVLDWKEMVQRYQNSKMKIVHGSDHGISDFESHLPFVLNFVEQSAQQ
jgi:predicted esterase YcpF (UPF0227 family)